MDIFFRSFLAFDYNLSLLLATLYVNLRGHERWRRGYAESDNAWNRYQDALESELHMWYSVENDLATWYTLCRTFGVKPLSKTCKRYEEVGDRTTKFGKLILTRIICCTKDTR